MDTLKCWFSLTISISILEQQQAIRVVLANDCKNLHHMPIDHNVSVLETVVSVLRPLSIFTDALSDEKQLTISVVHPLLRHTLDNILKFCQ